MFRIAAPLGVLALMLVACGEVTRSGPPASIEFDVPTQHSMWAGARHTMRVTVRDAAGRAIAGVPIVWKSSNAAVARVESDGVLVADSSGIARITAIAATVSAVFDVTVAQSVAVLQVAPADTTLQLLHSVPLRIQAMDGAGRPVPSDLIEATFATSDSSVLTVDTAGVVFGSGWGTAEITVTADGVSETVTLTSQPLEKDLGGIQLVRLDLGYPSNHCGLDAGGAAYCWGVNVYGEVGRSIFLPHDTAAVFQVQTSLRFTDISVGQNVACGLTAGREMWCWGDNRYGSLGIGAGAPDTIWHSPDPMLVAGGHQWKQMNVGEHRASCAIAETDEIYCWGHNDREQTGRAPFSQGDPRVAPMDGSFTGESVDLGIFGGCATRPGDSPVCWGILSPNWISGQSYAPAVVPGAPVLAQVSAGSYHACGLTSAGEAYCWGHGNPRELGRGMETDPVLFSVQGFQAPAPVLGGLRFKKLALAGASACGLTLEGRIHCWGTRFLWPGGTASPPLRVGPPELTFIDIDGGQARFCALTSDSRAFCW